MSPPKPAAKGRAPVPKPGAARPGVAKPDPAQPGKAKASGPASRAKPAAKSGASKAVPAGGSVSKGGARPSGQAAKPAPQARAKASARQAAKPGVSPAPTGTPGKSPGKSPVRPGGRTLLVAPIAVSPKVEAPKKFQREYKKWLERLILLRHALLRDGERLEEEGLKALEQEVSVDHMADYGSDSYEQDNTLALIESKSEALRDVDESIRKIEAGSYGLCEECEQLIPSGRLAVLPHARFCVGCQAKREGVVE